METNGRLYVNSRERPSAAAQGKHMTRVELAYLLLALLVATLAAVVILSYRFTRYQRALRQGHRDVAPVWRPFWMP